MLRHDNKSDTRKDKNFLTKWEGSFWVVKWYDDGSYKLQDVSSKIHKTRVNGWRLKPYLLRFEAGASSSSSSEGDDEEDSSSSPKY